ncbi:Pol polyprotein [Elysia marginata]|uniref:Pol polyprotein n=1 Tax=Elysia marginata TaxID=1093978 RepID=A0AAV4H809_9GAST|nr:Pol polyprotein [Elysia marginata]
MGTQYSDSASNITVVVSEHIEQDPETPGGYPVPLRKDVEIELQKLQEQGIIKQVTEPTDWCSGLIVVPKANGENTSLRGCDKTQ